MGDLLFCFDCSGLGLIARERWGAPSEENVGILRSLLDVKSSFAWLPSERLRRDCMDLLARKLAAGAEPRRLRLASGGEICRAFMAELDEETIAAAKEAIR
jgi:hypothetical protein